MGRPTKASKTGGKKVEKLSRSSLEAYGGVAIAICMGIFPMSLGMKLFLVAVLAILACDIIYRSSWTSKWPHRARVFVGVFAIAAIFWFSWNSIKDASHAVTSFVCNGGGGGGGGGAGGPNGGGGGGGGACGFFGGNGGNGGNGGFPGGAGGGSSTQGRQSGNGANGEIIITYTQKSATDASKKDSKKAEVSTKKREVGK